MRVMAVVEHCVAAFILSAIVFAFLMSLINCVAPVSKADQSAGMDQTLEIYRAFSLSPETLRAHNAEIEQQARADYERIAGGGK